METITFYSYKGGVGRTLALKNYALFLAKYGFSVCLMDFDFEAPGLHYKFKKYLGGSEMRGKKGLVDIINSFQQQNIIPENFQDYILRPQVNVDMENFGKITILPAGDSMSANYWKNLSTISWENLFYQPESAGDLFFLELKERINSSIKPDFLLIDSRTGITEIGGLCTSLLPDKVIFMISNNDENKEGARLILRNLKTINRPWGGPIEIIFVLSRFPAHRDFQGRIDETDEKILQGIRDFINEPETTSLHSNIIDDIGLIISVEDLERSEDSEADVELLYTKLFADIAQKQPKVKERIDQGLDFFG